MCFHKSNTKSKIEIETRFKAAFQNFDHVPIFHENGFDHKPSAIITMNNPGLILGFSWGLVPNWTKDKASAMAIRSKTLNAKLETAFDLPSFKMPIMSNRCLVLADGFFEWMAFNGKKFPHFVALKDNSVFAMAGIYDVWLDKNTGEKLESFSILTCEANALMSRIHNIKKRMPIILTQDQERYWLDPGLTVADMKTLLKPYDDQGMKAHTISKLINESNSNNPEVVNYHPYHELNFVQGTLF